jgi:hypothetical protein
MGLGSHLRGTEVVVQGRRQGLTLSTFDICLRLVLSIACDPVVPKQAYNALKPNQAKVPFGAAQTLTPLRTPPRCPVSATRTTVRASTGSR